MGEISPSWESWESRDQENFMIPLPLGLAVGNDSFFSSPYISHAFLFLQNT
jgi:hypothetical protein